MRPLAHASGFQSCPISAKPIKSTARLFWRTNGRHSQIDPFPSALGLVDLVTRHVSEGRYASTRSRFGFPKLPYFGETY